MIFKSLRNRRGNALLTALAIGASSAILGYSVLMSLKGSMRISQKSAVESTVMMTAHATAAMLKQDVADNYSAYIKGTRFTSCPRPSGTTEESKISGFLQMLNAPPGGADSACGRSEFISTFFGNVPRNPTGTPIVYASPTPGAGGTSMSLANLKGAELIPSSKVNGYETKIKIEQFQMAAGDNRLMGEITLAGSKLEKKIRMVIDVNDIINPARDLATCRICRTMPGSNCCDVPAGNTIVTFQYLESGTGRVIEANFDTVTRTLLLAPLAAEPANPRAVTMRNLSTTRTDYSDGDFCAAAIGSGPLRFMMDVVRVGGVDYYLASDGRLIDNAGINRWATPDPKILSVGYATSWLILRHDGAVFTTNNIDDPSTFTEFIGLRIPNAERIISGEGPAIPAACP